MELTLDQFERIQGLLVDLRDDAGVTRTEIALLRQEVTYMKEHLARMNGRVGKSEDRLNAIETAAIEVRGAWRAAVALASVLAAAIGAAASWIIGGLYGQPKS